ncbi:DUF6794 domain-containing protein [Paenibacillus sp. WLX1005]|uniref:DUF6794 domain-containing protein n=1 Tax=Paenibacillus sp. WLX1005 TaxID=3243766 RepID=UPI0039843E9C
MGRPQKIVIDSMYELIDYIIEHDLDDENKEKLRAMDTTIGLHFSFGMYIRNHYELSDRKKVPHLIAEFKQSLLDNMTETYGEMDEETKDFYDFLHTGMCQDDDMSGHISREIWKKVRKQ